MSRDLGEKIKALPDVAMDMPLFEGTLKRHQRIGISWLYHVQRGLLADSVGLGKTIHAIGLLCILKERGQLKNRAIIVMRPAALLQWKSELERFAPKLAVEVAIGTKSQRREKYCSNFDVLLIGYQMFLHDRREMAVLEPDIFIFDDVDPLRNRQNETAHVARTLARDAERVVVMSGTPLQIRLHELYANLEVVDQQAVMAVFGAYTKFERRYVRTEQIVDYDPRKGRKVVRNKITGYKNMNEFKELAAPFCLRRTHHDLDSSDLPDIVSEDIWLDLYKDQEVAYKKLQKGVLELLREEGKEVKHVAAMSKLQYGSRICAGMGFLEGHVDQPGVNSVKLDWLLDTLTGDLSGEKAVVFCIYKDTIRMVQSRLASAGISFVTIWGDEPDPQERYIRQRQFWDDPNCRVCLGTSAMEQSLNLQISRVLINIDMMMNPARMEQLLGRIRRLGSQHPTVYVFNVLTRDTQEERYLPVLKKRQAVADFVWGEESELFEQLSSMELLQLITPE